MLITLQDGGFFVVGLVAGLVVGLSYSAGLFCKLMKAEFDRGYIARGEQEAAFRSEQEEALQNASHVKSSAPQL